jgi:hypothetical protein
MLLTRKVSFLNDVLAKNVNTYSQIYWLVRQNGVSKR